MPGSRLEVFESAGHFPHLSDQARFLSVIRDFLATTVPACHRPEGTPSVVGGRKLRRGYRTAGTLPRSMKKMTTPVTET